MSIDLFVNIESTFSYCYDCSGFFLIFFLPFKFDIDEFFPLIASKHLRIFGLHKFY